MPWSLKNTDLRRHISDVETTKERIQKEKAKHFFSPAHSSFSVTMRRQTDFECVSESKGWVLPNSFFLLRRYMQHYDAEEIWERLVKRSSRYNLLMIKVYGAMNSLKKHCIQKNDVTNPKLRYKRWYLKTRLYNRSIFFMVPLFCIYLHT